MWLDNLNRIKKSTGLAFGGVSEAPGWPRGPTKQALCRSDKRPSVIHRFRCGSLHGLYSRRFIR